MLLDESVAALTKSLEVDPEQAQAWWLMNRACEKLGDGEGAAAARVKHATYKPDENARDRAVRLARERYPWANHAAEATVLYDLQRVSSASCLMEPELNCPHQRPPQRAEEARCAVPCGSLRVAPTTCGDDDVWCRRCVERGEHSIVSRRLLSTTATVCSARLSAA